MNPIFYTTFICLLFAGNVLAAEIPFIEIKGTNNWNVGYCAAFSPDGTKLVTSGRGFTPRIWDIETQKELLKLEGHTKSIDDKRAVIVHTVVFSPDGKKIATASSDGTARIWDAETGKELHKLEGHTDIVYSAAFSPDGKKVVTASDDATAIIWDVETGKELLKLEGHRIVVYSAAFSPDGKTIVSAGGGEYSSFIDSFWSVRIWDAESGKELQRLEKHTKYIRSAAFSPDGKRIVSTSGDETVVIWSASGWSAWLQQKMVPQRVIHHFEAVHSAVFSPDGKKIITTSGGQLEDENGREDYTVRIWDAESGNLLQTLTRNPWTIGHAAFSPCGKKAVTTTWDGITRIWTLEE